MESVSILLLCTFLSFGPALLYAWWIYWLDRYEKEPKVLLGVVFLWGAVVAAGAAFVIKTVLGLGVYLFTESEAITNLTTGSLIAPVIEEALKGFAVMVVFLLFRKEFDSILDGIIYGGIAALGFAATENVYYIYTYGYQEEGLTGIAVLFFLRVLVVGWQHPFYTAFTGIGFAIARLNRPLAVKFLVPLLGLLLAMFTHSVHNTLAGLISGWAGLAVMVLFDWSGWLAMFGVIVWAIFREKQWLVKHLREEVESGVISAAQYRVACSAWAVSFARFTALFGGRFRVTRRFYQLTAELAYKKHQRATLGEEGGNSAMIEKYRAELAQLSPQVIV
jgi:RsiW-degrading membrane proteinase PrsW (M82 family)